MRDYDYLIAHQLSPTFQSILKLEEARASTSNKQQQKEQVSLLNGSNFSDQQSANVIKRLIVVSFLWTISLFYQIIYFRNFSFQILFLIDLRMVLFSNNISGKISLSETPSQNVGWKSYHPISLWRKYSNCCLSRGFVNMSAICSLVWIASILIALFLTWFLKWWYFIAMCLVLGLYFGARAIPARHCCLQIL